MDKQIERLIADNPNLSSASIARLAGISRYAVGRLKAKMEHKQNWSHRGCGIPFVSQSVNKDGVYLSLWFSGRVLSKGNIEGVMDNLDRLIYCLENNEGKLPPTRKESYFIGLEFIC